LLSVCGKDDFALLKWNDAKLSLLLIAMMYKSNLVCQQQHIWGKKDSHEKYLTYSRNMMASFIHLNRVCTVGPSLDPENFAKEQ
jgi:hypothetical protein